MWARCRCCVKGAGLGQGACMCLQVWAGDWICSGPLLPASQKGSSSSCLPPGELPWEAKERSWAPQRETALSKELLCCGPWAQARVRELETQNALMQRELDHMAEVAQCQDQQLRWDGGGGSKRAGGWGKGCWCNVLAGATAGCVRWLQEGLIGSRVRSRRLGHAAGGAAGLQPPPPCSSRCAVLLLAWRGRAGGPHCCCCPFGVLSPAPQGCRERAGGSG